MMSRTLQWSGILSLLCVTIPLYAAVPMTLPGDRLLDAYFRAQTSQIADRCLADVKTLEDWTTRRLESRRQLAEMLGLWPEPPRTDLKPVITGKIDHDTFTIEKLQFQSRPGLYVTADVYVPKNLAARAPAILYVCGHSLVKKDGISYGNKTAHQHHAIWFARNGYVCLVVDTLQLGEIEGIHHGLYREKMWWWMSRGYTPAGVEAWNAMRCLDYLQSRPEVDPERLGMTGRSGGGATSWYTGALDERVKVVVPVAGITDLQNQIVDGCVEGHCDCMFMTNTYRWDFAQVAALIAPRPLLLGNSDKDTIFPLDGVQRLHAKVRALYHLYSADDHLGLLITEGPHKDTQDLQVPAFRWFNRYLKNDTGPLKDATAEPLFEVELLRVFPPKGSPADQLNTKIQETFVAVAPPPSVPASQDAWARQRDAWMKSLGEKTFGGWPTDAPPIELKEAFSASHSGIRLIAYDFTSQEHVPLRLYVARADAKGAVRSTHLRVLDQAQWDSWLATMRVGFAKELADQLPATPAGEAGAFTALAEKIQRDGEAVAWLAPRGIGPTAWSGDEKRRTHVLRRFGLLGQTLDGMRVWDVRRTIQAIRKIPDLSQLPLTLQAQGRMAGVVLYASLFEPNLAGIDLLDLPASHQQGPELLNVMKTFDIPAALAMAVERCDLRLRGESADTSRYAQSVLAALDWTAHKLDDDQTSR